MPSSDKTEEASKSDSELSDVSPFTGGGSLVSLPLGNAEAPPMSDNPHKIFPLLEALDLVSLSVESKVKACVIALHKVHNFKGITLPF